MQTCIAPFVVVERNKRPKDLLTCFTHLRRGSHITSAPRTGKSFRNLQRRKQSESSKRNPNQFVLESPAVNVLVGHFTLGRHAAHHISRLHLKRNQTNNRPNQKITLFPQPLESINLPSLAHFLTPNICRGTCQKVILIENKH